MECIVTKQQLRLEKGWTGKIKSLSFKTPNMKGWRTPFSFSANKYEIRFSDGWGYPYDDFNEEEKKNAENIGRVIVL